MEEKNIHKKIEDYLKRIDDTRDDKCWFCGKTPDQIRREFFEIMKDPPAEFEELGVDDLLIMTYKTQKPVCAGCYFAIKRNPEQVKEILERPQDEIW